MNGPRLLTVNDVAALLTVSRYAVYSMIARGEIPHIRVSERRVRFDERRLREWLESRAAGGSPAA